MKKIIIPIIFIFVLVTSFFVYDYFKTTSSKNVEDSVLAEFRQDVLKAYEIDDMEIYFRRPSLWIEINSEKKLSDKTIGEIKEKLKPIINKDNMDKISDKYWTKGSSLFYVYVLFNEKKGDSKTNYLEIELTKSKGYKNWD